MGAQFFVIARDPQYYLKEPSQMPPEFKGKAAMLMGIEGEFSAEMHLRLFAGLNPHTGDRLTGMRSVANRRGAWDITFNQPKSISVLEQLTGDTRIAGVREWAEERAMAKLEKQVRIRVSKASEIEEARGVMPEGWKHPERFSGNIIYSKFRHGVNRDGDPHSHTHVLLYNEAFDMKEKQWKTLELRYIDSKGIRDGFHDDMVKGVKELGYRASRDGNSFVIHDFPKDVHHEFSQRHAAIKVKEGEMAEKAQAFRKAKGLPEQDKPLSPKVRGKLSLYNRPEKEYVPIDVRRRGWLSRLSKSQLDGLYSFVGKAKATVNRLKVRASLQRHLTRSKETVAHEVNHERGIGR